MLQELTYVCIDVCIGDSKWSIVFWSLSWLESAGISSCWGHLSGDRSVRPSLAALVLLHLVSELVDEVVLLLEKQKPVVWVHHSQSSWLTKMFSAIQFHKISGNKPSSGHGNSRETELPSQTEWQLVLSDLWLFRWLYLRSSRNQVSEEVTLQLKWVNVLCAWFAGRVFVKNLRTTKEWITHQALIFQTLRSNYKARDQTSDNARPVSKKFICSHRRRASWAELTHLSLALAI